MFDLDILGKNARKAAQKLSLYSGEMKNEGLLACADALLSKEGMIISENAADIDGAEKNIGDGIARLRTKEPRLHDGRNFINPRHSGGITADVDIHQTGINSNKSLNEFILAVGQFVLLTIVPFAVLIVTFVQSTEEDDYVSLPGFLHSLGSEFGL